MAIFGNYKMLFMELYSKFKKGNVSVCLGILLKTGCELCDKLANYCAAGVLTKSMCLTNSNNHASFCSYPDMWLPYI